MKRERLERRKEKSNYKNKESLLFIAIQITNKFNFAKFSSIIVKV